MRTPKTKLSRVRRAWIHICDLADTIMVFTCMGLTPAHPSFWEDYQRRERRRAALLKS
jgi:hypothetical protein